MKQKAQVHALAADRSELFKCLDKLNGDQWYYSTDGSVTRLDNIVPYHLYFTSDEKIQEGDWLISKNGNIHQAKRYTLQYKDDRKIIATTNPDLWAVRPYRQLAQDKQMNVALPKIPQDFIQLYVDKQGAIEEVEVEYEAYDVKRAKVEGVVYYPFDIEQHPVVDANFKLKLNTDGSVIWSLKEERMYTRDELVSEIRRYVFHQKMVGEPLESWLDRNYPA